MKIACPCYLRLKMSSVVPCSRRIEGFVSEEETVSYSLKKGLMVEIYVKYPGEYADTN